MTVFGLILMRYFLHYEPISVKKCCVIFCIMRYAIFSLRYTFFKVIMQRTNTGSQHHLISSEPRALIKIESYKLCVFIGVRYFHL